MTLIQLQIPVADPHDLTSSERDAMTGELRRRAGRELPVQSGKQPLGQWSHP
ncbi:hypothetical protein [Deinococcus sp. 12RED42]|uniref:hypothetical protein n=1 Tax=Deinococcus sp. 12RED42 TaxID=2745872 RepID=UPI001E470E7A|nr:hypothetical protein [Deinococcus sp. 12RED42]MCD0166395.1 hypothetical protein [Deinococcus sp. 12RED42]